MDLKLFSLMNIHIPCNQMERLKITSPEKYLCTLGKFLAFQ